MCKLEVCKKLSRLGWTSQAVVDYYKTTPDWVETFLYGICMETFLKSIVMNKITWDRTPREHTWQLRYRDGHMGRVKDI